MPTFVELLGAALGGDPGSPAAIEAVENHRRELARAYLTSTGSDRGSAEQRTEVGLLAANGFPWSPVAEDYELARAIHANWAPAPAPNVLMAAMALAPAHHFPPPPRLAQVPAWLRLRYVGYLFARPRLFIHAGDAERYAAHSERAMATVREAIFIDRLPDAPEIAKLVAQIDSGMVYFGEHSLMPYFRDKARITEWTLLEADQLLGHGFPLIRRELPRIGILHRSLTPGTETYHLLGHLIGRDRSTAEVFVYLFNTGLPKLAGTFDAWADEVVQLTGDVGDAVARIRSDDLDLCFISNNIGWGLPAESAIAAHRLARVQVVSGASPCTAGFSSSDLFLSSAANDPNPDAQDDYVEKLAFVPGAVGSFGFGLDADPRTVELSREQFGVGQDEVLFFSAANCYKLTPELLAAWAEILARVPKSRLVVMPFNPNWGSVFPVALLLRRIDRQLIRFGVSSNRVVAIAQVPTRADLHAAMSQADIYLDSFPYSGACSLVDPLMVGLPVVGRSGSRLRTAQGGSLLRAEGLGSAVCADTEAYIRRAVRLAADPTYREEEADRVRRAAASGLACLRTEVFAQRFFSFCVETVWAAHDRIAAQRRSSAKTLRRDIDRAVRLAFAHAAPAFLRLHDTEVVRQLIAPWLKTLSAEGAAAGRVIVVTPEPAEPGALSTDPIGIGLGVTTTIRVPAATLRACLIAEPGQVDVIKIDAQCSDLDTVREIEFAAASPKIVMIEYGLAFHDQTVASIGALISEMRAHGYDAAVFEYRRLKGFGVTNWEHELASIGFGEKALGKRGNARGNIIFHKRDDTVFLTCLAQLLEAYGPAPTRPAFANAAAAREPATMTAVS